MDNPDRLRTPGTLMQASGKLRVIKLVHTIVWAVLAACVLAIPVMAILGQPKAAGVLIAVVLVEVAVLAGNRMRCPLTDLAARHTLDREPNFDIYLPRWLAKYNQRIFGTLYVFGIVLTLISLIPP